jgi:hypothetical protein
MLKFFMAAVAALTLAAPLAAQAQPSYSQPYPSGEENIHGRIVSFDGGYNLSVRDERGFIDNVQLHQGTIINPTGLTLAPGMVVSILGYNAGPFLAANEIDTPYLFTSGVPYYAGRPWDYYGPSISLGFFFGNTGWWHGDRFGAGYHYSQGARVYPQARFGEVYRGGELRGRDYVAPREQGGYYPGHAPQRDPRGDRNGGYDNRGGRGERR